MLRENPTRPGPRPPAVSLHEVRTRGAGKREWARISAIGSAPRESWAARRNDLMTPLSLVRNVAAALVSLLGYPRTIGDELRGRMLG